MASGYAPLAWLPAGQVLTRDREAALQGAYVSNGFQPLSQAQITAAVGAAIAYPTSLPRFDDSNPQPREG